MGTLRQAIETALTHTTLHVDLSLDDRLKSRFAGHLG